MFIKSVQSCSVDSIGRTIQRVTTYGKHKNTHFAVDNWNYKGNTIQKRIVAWGDNWQKIVNKIRNKNGKFERIGG